MIIDARHDIENGASLSFDVCIVGSGPAGLTLALELAPLGLCIGVLEAGGRAFSKNSQDYFRGKVSGTHANEHLHSFRYRRLGGTSTAWGGRCLMYDPIDFERREYVPDSGWPIAYDTLIPHYERALDKCEAGPMAYDAATVLPEKTPQMVAGMSDGDVISSLLERWSPPTDFGKRYESVLRGSDNVTVLLNAACVAINLNDAHENVTSLDVRTEEKSFTVSAKRFVLAAGGIEVPRLLLSSNRQMPQGIGNQHDLVGRYFMTHLTGVVATAHLCVNPATVAHQYDCDENGVYVRRRITFSPEAQRRERLPNLSIQFHVPSVNDPSHCNAVLSVMFMAKHIGSIRRGIPPGLGITDDEDQDYPVGLWLRHLRNLVIDAPGFVGFAPSFAYRRFLKRRRIPSVVLPNKQPVYPMHYAAEQSPNRYSRVTLADERDRYGLPRAELNFRVREADIEGVCRAHTLLGEYFRRHKIGDIRFHSKDPLDDIRRATRAVNGHFIGTTRMAEDPKHGVVDLDCRVFGTGNLYVASSAVFPTSSHANPTLTIVALAIRLADHLRYQVTSHAVPPGIHDLPCA
jgi:choline dehydrogenase-like flavoprotein